jgi:hypothetical protein
MSIFAKMKSKSNSFLISSARKMGFALFVIYTALLSLTFLSYNDEILPPLTVFEFLIGDEDIDHCPHIEAARHNYTTKRTFARPVYPDVICVPATLRANVPLWVARQKQHRAANWLQHGDQLPFFGAFRI